MSGMPYPTIDLNKKKVIILSGFQKCDEGGKMLSVVAMEKLKTEAERHSDAVAFTFVSGRWVPAA